MMDITDFLLARVAEDEALASAAIAPGERHPYGDKNFPETPPEGMGDVLNSYLGGTLGAHAAAWHPLRVLAECAAKRRILEFHKQWPVLVEQRPEIQEIKTDDMSMHTLRMTRQIAWMTEQAYVNVFGTAPPTSQIVKAMAVPYADHPDFQEEWSI